MKRVLKWIGAVVLLLVIAAGATWYSAFANNLPIVDGAEIAPGVLTVKDGFVSVFVIDVGGGKVALIDAGNDKEGKAVLGALSKRGLTPASVAAIFLTHGHGDHIAGCKLFPDAQVYALAAEAERIGDKCTLKRSLRDGEVVDVGDVHVETFSVPGHTDGSAVYLARGVLFFGDSAGGSKDGGVMKAVRLFSHDSTQNVAALKALEERLAPRAAEIKELAFAHSGPLAGFGPLADFASKH